MISLNIDEATINGIMYKNCKLIVSYNRRTKTTYMYMIYKGGRWYMTETKFELKNENEIHIKCPYDDRTIRHTIIYLSPTNMSKFIKHIMPRTRTYLHRDCKYGIKYRDY